MVDNVFPVDAVAGAPSYSGRKLRQTASPLLAGATTARPLGSRSGVRPGTPKTTVTATSTTWTCKAFAGSADVEAAGEAGSYQFGFDAVATGAIGAAGGGARVDTLWVQVDDPAEGDGTTAPAVRRVYTAQGAAVPPRAFAVAKIYVPASGGGNPSVTWVAPTAVAAGAPVPVDNATERAALVTAGFAFDGMIVVQRDTNSLWIFTGAAWKALAEDSGWLTLPTGPGWIPYGAPWSTPKYRRLNGLIWVLFALKNGSSNTVVTIPSSAWPSEYSFVELQGNSSGSNGARAQLQTNGELVLQYYYGGASNAAVFAMFSFVPAN